MRPQFPQARVENRTDARGQGPAPAPRAPRAGHGWYAHEARRALGIGAEVLGVRVPVPLFHGAVGLIAAATALLVAPQRVGTGAAVALDLLLAVCAVGAVLYYDRVLCPPAARPGIAATLLPGAALLALFIVIAGGVAPVLVGVAVGLCAVVVGSVPHLDALRAAGRGGAGLRGLRELAGLAIVLPVCVLAAAPTVSIQVRTLVALVGWAAATHDLVRSQGGSWWRTLVASLGTGLAVAGLVTLIGRGGNQAGGAAALLLAGYGVRGVAAQALTGRRGAVLFEYAAFAVAGLGVLVTAR